MTRQSQVVVIGAGELGQAVGLLLKKNGAAVQFWDTNPSLVTLNASLEAMIPAAEYILFCVPSWAIGTAVARVLSLIPRGAVMICFTKGIEAASQKTMAEFLPGLFPGHEQLVVVGGPMLAEEIASGKNAIGVFASKSAAALDACATIFSSESFTFERSDDPLSVSLSGVLKNIYAVALGIADGLDLSGNEKGWITARAIEEMVAVGKNLGADENVVLGTAGVADFIATGYSPYSRNRQIGNEIVKNGKCDLRGEGLSSLPLLIARLGSRAGQFPLLHFIYEVGIDCVPAAEALRKFLHAQ